VAPDNDMERTRLFRRPLVWIILVIAGAVALSYLISGGPTYTKWDTSDVLSNLRSGNAKSVVIEDKEQTLDLVLKNKVKVKGAETDRIQASIPAESMDELQTELDKLVGRLEVELQGT